MQPPKLAPNLDGMSLEELHGVAADLQALANACSSLEADLGGELITVRMLPGEPVQIQLRPIFGLVAAVPAPDPDGGRDTAYMQGLLSEPGPDPAQAPVNGGDPQPWGGARNAVAAAMAADGILQGLGLDQYAQAIATELGCSLEDAKRQLQTDTLRKRIVSRQEELRRQAWARSPVAAEDPAKDPEPPARDLVLIMDQPPRQVTHSLALQVPQGTTARECEVLLRLVEAADRKWPPAKDLALVEGICRGDNRDELASDLGVKVPDLLDRWATLKAAAEKYESPLRLQRALLDALRILVGNASQAA